MTLALPDLPRWVEAHGIAADPASWQRAGCVGHDAARLIVITPEAEASAIAALAAAHPHHTLLAATEAHARATGRVPARALLHTLPDPEALPDVEGAVVLPADADLAHLPAPLAEELARARPPIWSAWVDGAPVCFAYAPWRSAGWFDVSVDTLPGARQLGLATIVAAAMIRDERAQGREPVWGADEDNHGSLRLARRLGFVAVDELWVAPPVAG